MTRTKLLCGVLAAASLLLVTGCAGNQATASTSSTSFKVTTTGPSDVTVTARSGDGFNGPVTVTLDVTTASNPVKPTANLAAANQIVMLRSDLAHSGTLWVTVTVTGVGADKVTVDLPTVKPMS